MPVLVSTDGLRGDLEPPVGLAVRLPDEPLRAAELATAQFDTVGAVAQGHDGLVATGVTPAGVW